MAEIWAPVKGFEGLYDVSSLGRIRSLRTGQLRKAYSNGLGYLRVVFTVNGKVVTKYVHRLVAEAFVEPFDGAEVNHKDLDKANNTSSNLEWTTRSANLLHYYASRRSEMKVHG